MMAQSTVAITSKKSGIMEPTLGLVMIVKNEATIIVVGGSFYRLLGCLRYGVL